MKMLRIITLLSLLISPVTYASMLSVTPTQLFLSEAQPITVLTLTNPNSTPTLMQVDVMRWTQVEGKDHYQPTEDILATPPIFELPPYKSQVIRFAIQNMVNPRCEQAYRVYLKEVVARTKTIRRPNSQLKVALTIAIPVFIYPQSIERTFVWSAKWRDPQHVHLQLRNTGNVTLFTNAWQLFSGNKPLSRKQTVFSYIHPHQSQSWAVKVSRRSNLPIEVVANVNAQVIRAHVR